MDLTFTTTNKPNNSSWLSVLFFICLIPSNSSLATFSVMESTNQTSVCALIPSSSPPGKATLNCSTPPQFIHVNPNASFTSIVSGDGFLCTLLTTLSSSAMHCWRFSNGSGGGGVKSKRLYTGRVLQQLEAGNSHIFGLVQGTHQLLWWQWPGFKSTSNTRNFSSIAVGEDFVCGLTQNGTITCFGTGGNSPTSVTQHNPSGIYSAVAAGFRHVCAINVDQGGLHCWGDFVGEVPQGKFIDLALGENRSCALRYNQTVVCWGNNNDFSLPNALEGVSFLSIEAKRSVFCGVLTYNFSLYCWGNENFGSNFMVFDEVLPGPCTNTCPNGLTLPGSARLCGKGQIICDPRLIPQPLSQPSPDSGSGGRSGRMVALLVVGCLGSLELVLVSAFFLYKHFKCRGCRRVHDSGLLDAAAAAVQQGPTQHQNPQPQPAAAATAAPVLQKKLSQLASMGDAGHLEEFPLQILLEATSNFSEDHKIGTGSFGSVYKATLDDGRQVAVKRAEISSTSNYYAIGTTKRQEDNKDHAFINELESLSRLHHKNLVRLLGFCEDCHELVLIYEYMENGSLHDHLHNPPQTSSSPLKSWPARIKIALDAAKGIEYLHEYAVPSIIHRDIKSSNILLDATWTAKVSDFGLSLMGPGENKSHLSLDAAAGTVGYMDPEYYRFHQLTEKSDVYSFGVVLLEILSGYRAIHLNENNMPRNVVDFLVPLIVQDEIHGVLDPNVPTPPTPSETEALAYVGYLAADCVTLQGSDRPSMTEIVNILERALAACLNISPPSISRSPTASST